MSKPGMGLVFGVILYESLVFGLVAGISVLIGEGSLTHQVYVSALIASSLAFAGNLRKRLPQVREAAGVDWSD